MSELTDVIEALTREVADFPEPGVHFKDLTPVFADPRGLAVITEATLRLHAIPEHAATLRVAFPDIESACRTAAGIVGALTGVIGTLQAMEAIKLITGIGEPLVGRLLLYDALAASFETIRYRAR